MCKSITKQCSKCKEPKSISKFGKHSGKKDGLQSICKPCQKLYYRENREHLYPLIKKRTKERSTIIRKFVWDYLSDHPCIDCGISDPIVLEFDHMDRSTKSFQIGKAMQDGYSIERLEGEIAKCVVRCSNCHRRRTAKQLGWWKEFN